MDENAGRILVSGSRALDVVWLRRNGAPHHVIQAAMPARRKFIDALTEAVARLGAEAGGQVCIVHGRANYGADKWASQFLYREWRSDGRARLHLHVEEHAADWERWPRKAGMIRNGEMIASMDASKPHLVLVAWDGKSTGAGNIIDRATVAGLRIERTWR